MTWWKVLGVAAFAGVAAGGVLVAKDERRRRAYTPDEIRDRLHARVEGSGAVQDDGVQDDGVQDDDANDGARHDGEVHEP